MDASVKNTYFKFSCNAFSRFLLVFLLTEGLAFSCTAYRKRIAALESQISKLKMENDAAYEKAAASVDLDEVKNIAISKFGMIYANQGQIITYDVQDSDYESITTL